MTAQLVPPSVEELQRAEIIKLRKALAGVLPWVGRPETGPSWATDDAKRRNRQMCQEANAYANDCFPEAWGSDDGFDFVLPNAELRGAEQASLAERPAPTQG